MAMAFSFKATIIKVGINPCVDVPLPITKKLQSSKGYIPVKGTIDGCRFIQTLVPVKDKPYRLFVNGIMLKAAGAGVGDNVSFTIELNENPPSAETIGMPPTLKKRLAREKLSRAFTTLTPYRQMEVLRYLQQLKTEEALERNIEKIIQQLRKRTSTNAK